MTARGPKRGSSRLASVAADDDAAREGQEGEAGLERRVVQRALQVVGEEEEGAEQRDPDQQRGQERAAPVAVEDDPQREQRVAVRRSR